MTGDRKQRTPTARRWECAFPQPAGDLVDARVDDLWKRAFNARRTPFGDLRNQFRRQHCRTLNPYGSDTCPYSRDQCALAFEDAVRVTCDMRPRVPVGYFRKVAKTMGAIRADHKPLARDIHGIMGFPDHEHARREGIGGPVRRTEDGLSVGAVGASEHVYVHGSERTAEIDHSNGADADIEDGYPDGPAYSVVDVVGVGASLASSNGSVGSTGAGPEEVSAHDAQPGTSPAPASEDEGVSGANPRERRAQGVAAGQGPVRGSAVGPVSIGDLLGSLGIQPRQGPRQADDVEEGPER